MTNPALNPPRPAKRMRLAAAVLPLLLTVVIATPSGAAAPDLPSALDPAVRELIRQRVAAVEAAPDDAFAHARLGAAYEGNLLWAEARDAYRRAAELDPDEALWRLHEAIATRQAGDFPGAVALLREVARQAPAIAAAQQRLGLALLETGDLEEARGAFGRLSELRPEAPQGWSGLGEVLLELRQPGEALPLLERAVALAPEDRRARYLLGLAYRGVGRLEEARVELARGVGAATAYLPDPFTAQVDEAAVHLTARVDRAQALLQARRPGEAEALLEAVLADHPENVTVLNNLAIAKMHLGDLGSARELLERALEIDDRRFSTYLNLASWAQRSGQPERALELTAEAVARGPEVARAHVGHAQSLLRLGRLAEAAESLDRALELDFRDPQAMLTLGAVRLRLGQPEKALPVYERLVELYPEAFPAHLALARLYLAGGDPGAAHQALDRARALAPEHPEVAALAAQLAALGEEPPPPSVANAGGSEAARSLAEPGPRSVGAPPASEEAPAERRDLWFADVAGALGVDFRHVRSTTDRSWFPEIMGGGGGWLDYDGDGDLDLYLVQGGDLAATGDAADPTDRLYRNDGVAGFVDVTRRAGVALPGWGMGVAAGDIDGDGDLDLHVTRVGANLLLENLGDGTFADVSVVAGVDHPGWGSSSAFVDTDVDGDLDLFVVNYVNWSRDNEIQCFSGGERDYCHPLQYNAPAADVLYRNDGTGRFAEITAEAGIAGAFGNGLGVAVADFDADGLVDLYVANDGMPNQLWTNLGGGRFEDTALLSGSAVSGAGMAEAGMGVVAVDVEGDGDADLFMTHLRDETNTFYRNLGGLFEDATVAMGLAAPSVSTTGFGTGFADFDNDGWLDLYVVNGRVGGSQEPLTPEDRYAEPNHLFVGLGPARFRPASPPDGTAEGRVENSRALALGDYDRDGDMDLVIVNNGGPARILENRRGSAAAWVAVAPVSAAGAPFPGVSVRVDAAGRSHHGLAQPAYGYCATNDPETHFGLGRSTRVEAIELGWPDGATVRLLDLPVGVRLVVPRSVSPRP